SRNRHRKSQGGDRSCLIRCRCGTAAVVWRQRTYRRTPMIERGCHELSRRAAIRLLGGVAGAGGGSFPSKVGATIASTLEARIADVERHIVDLADAMPESRFDFSPESLGIPGSEYKGVRTFALQVRHVAASNYALWSSLTEETFPRDFLGGDGP